MTDRELRTACAAIVANIREPEPKPTRQYRRRFVEGKR